MALSDICILVKIFHSFFIRTTLARDTKFDMIHMYMSKTNTKKRILTGDTPTGKLHIGHFIGTLENRVLLQDEYETFIILADLHALTTKSKEPKEIGEYTREVALDNLAVGLDPQKATLFVESAIPEIYELAAFFSMFVTHATALRNPTIKDEIVLKNLGEQFSLGFVNYPIYQAADILSVKGELVPVGIDQEAHIEQTREIARAVNAIAGYSLFPEPKAKIGRIGKLVGTDGNPKMSKSLGNTIYLSDTKEEVEKRVAGMYTDPNRIHKNDPGKIEGNPLFIYLDTFGTQKDQSAIVDFKDRYQKGAVGDVEVKQYLAGVMNRFLEPIRERRAYFEHRPKEVDEIIHTGNTRVRSIVRETLKELRDAFGFYSK